jgi:hypothetical protein
MVSRKKAKGKERKAKSQAQAATQGVLGLSPMEARRRLKWTSKVNPALGHAFFCNHGCPPIPHPGHPVANFFDALVYYEEEIITTRRPLCHVMKEEFIRHRAVFDDATHRQLVISIMMTMGVNILLNGGNMGLVAAYASYIFHLEIYGSVGDFNAALWRSIRLERDIREGGFERDVIRFFLKPNPNPNFEKRITCSCLTAKYSHAKLLLPQIMGKCDKCEKKRERRTLMLCERCKTVQYCCKECQADDWPEHKDYCQTFWNLLCFSAHNSKCSDKSSCAHINILFNSPW